ncbi:MAG TPA: hypothetical protein VJJ76_01970 [archaeon]|nr:hypothetical protein [archaeon]
MKITKKAGTIMAILFIVLMMGSTIAYSFIQAINFGLYGNSGQVKLPDTNLLDYDLSIAQEQLALQEGKTVVKYSYSTTCVECLGLANQLEGLANQLKDQVIIIRLVQSSGNQTATLSLASAENSKLYSNPTTGDIVDGLCDVLINPPVDCALRKV